MATTYSYEDICKKPFRKISERTVSCHHSSSRSLWLCFMGLNIQLQLSLITYGDKPHQPDINSAGGKIDFVISFVRLWKAPFCQYIFYNFSPGNLVLYFMQGIFFLKVGNLMAWNPKTFHFLPKNAKNPGPLWLAGTHTNLKWYLHEGFMPYHM